MQAAASMSEASRRLEEASAIFRFKARSTMEEFDDVSGQWADSRGRNFSGRLLQPQRESIEDGGRLCRMHAELITSAQSEAGAAERESSAFAAARDEFESAEASTRESVQTCRELASRATGESNRCAAEITAINGAIASAAQDPGW